MITWKHWWLKWDKVLCCICCPCKASSRFIKLGGFVVLYPEVNLLLLVFCGDLDVLKLVRVIETEPFFTSWFIFRPAFFAVRLMVLKKIFPMQGQME